jgi:RNA polymerase-binding protein DksA
MATTRSKRPVRPSPAKSKSGKSAPKAKRTAPKKAAKSAARPVVKKAVKPVKAVAKPAAKPAIKPVAKAPIGKPMVKAVAGKIAPISAKPAALPVKSGKGVVATKPLIKPVVKGKGRMPAAPPVVKPLGVLPPESRVKAMEKMPAPMVRPRPVAPPAPKPATQGVQRVTERDMKFFEERLLAERQKILKDMGHLENTVLKVNQRDSSGDLSGYSFHMADAGTDAMEREKAFMFASAEGRMLMQIDDALRRLYNGVYGTCEMCGNPIARARLEAMPYARLCVSCKEKEEKANRGQAQNQGPGPAGS